MLVGAPRYVYGVLMMMIGGTVCTMCRGVVRVRDRHRAPTTVSVYVFETETARHSILDVHCLPAPETQTEAGPHSTRQHVRTRPAAGEPHVTSEATADPPPHATTSNS